MMNNIPLWQCGTVCTRLTCKGLKNKRGHMVCKVTMGWFRTTLTIFRQGVWAETCCYAPKVLCFQCSLLPLSKKPLSVFSIANSSFISVTSTILSGRCCNYRLLQQPMQGSLLSSHGWFTILISRSHRS